MLAIVNVPWMHKEKSTTSHEGALYAALDVIGQGDPALAQAIHDETSPPPFSAHLHDGLLRIGCLTTDVFLAVAQSRLAHKAERQQEDSFETLLRKASENPPSTVKLVFASPAAFGLNGQSHLLPEPRLVFGSLIRRWRQFDGPAIPDLRECETAVISVKIQARKRTLSKYVQYGFTGNTLYRVPEDVACWYHTLSMFAEYSGVGQRTSQGFGRIIYEQPKSLRRSNAQAVAR